MPQIGKWLPISLFPFLFISVLFLFRYHFFPLYEPLIQEDAFFEWWQFGAYTVAAVAFMALGLRSRTWPKWLRRLVFFGGGVLFIIAGEEISWGQRVFDIQNPEYFAKHNVQSELTLHNLSSVQSVLAQGYMVVCILLATAQIVVIGVRHVLRKQKKIDKLMSYVQRLVPPWYLAGYFIPVSVFYALFVFWRPFGAVMSNGVLLMVGRDQEVFETLLAMGVMITAVLPISEKGKQ